MQRFLFFLVVIGIYSCVPKEEKTYTNIDLTLDSKEVQKLIDFQDAMLYDSLYPFLKHVDPSLRYLAFKSFASQFDKNSKDSLIQVLDDPILENKAMISYALGQSKDPSVMSSLMKAFVQIDTNSSVNNISNRNILEAIGKTGDKRTLSLIAEVDYIPADDKLIMGQVRAIYQYSIRGITDEKATDKMINFTIESHYNEDIRHLASAYLERSSTIDLSKYKARLRQRFIKEKNVFVKMNLATALGRTKDTEVMHLFFKELKQENDYRVKINMIKALGNFPYINIVEPILFGLTDQNQFVAMAAADMLSKYGNKYDASIYQNFISDRNHYQLNAKIYNAVLSNLSPRSGRSRRLAIRLTEKIKSASSDMEKISYIRAIGTVSSQYVFLSELLTTGNSTAVKTAILEALVLMYEKADKVYFSHLEAERIKIFEVIKASMLTKDVGAVAIGALMISDEKNKLKSMLKDDISWLQELQGQLMLPEAIESYNELSKAIAYLSGSVYIAKEIMYQHPINWSLLSGINDSTRCTIKTNKGDITIKLFPMNAPGSVLNFIDLIKSNFYSGKIFHRVSPNFVVQSGCPRGDGYGSKDYTIRSEFGDKYFDDEGYIGMASAGKNTESTQWFITHRPTAHLDGNYSIFGKVTKGMNVVHQITQGDIISSISIGKL